MKEKVRVEEREKGTERYFQKNLSFLTLKTVRESLSRGRERSDLLFRRMTLHNLFLET